MDFIKFFAPLFMWFAFLLFVGLAPSILVGWLAGSAITSGVKTMSGDCGKTYPVEVVFSGDWFCAEEE